MLYVFGRIRDMNASLKFVFNEVSFLDKVHLGVFFLSKIFSAADSSIVIVSPEDHENEVEHEEVHGDER